MPNYVLASTILSLVLLRCDGNVPDVKCQIEEKMPVNSLVCDLAVKNVQLTSNYSFGIVQMNDFKYFNMISSRLFVQQVIDRDAIAAKQGIQPENTSLVLQILVLFEDSKAINVKIEITDINDHAPQFEVKSAVEIVKENNFETFIPIPLAKDADSGQNGAVEYLFPQNVISKRWYQLFKIEMSQSKMPWLKILNSLDKETMSENFELVIIARDYGQPSKESNVTLFINIEDENEFPPEFETFANNTLEIKESLPLKSCIIQIKATDKDFSNEIQYGLVPDDASSNFQINSTSGELFLKTILDADNGINNYELRLTASDGHPGGASRTVTTSIQIKVTDVNDNPPEIEVVSKLSQDQSIRVEENKPTDTLVAFITVSDKDVDVQNNQIFCDTTSFHLSTKDFKLDQWESGGKAVMYNLKTLRPLDREKRSRYTLSLTCRDKSPEIQEFVFNKTKIFTVDVTDVNDNGPRFDSDTLTIRSAENKAAGSSLGQVSARDLDSGHNARTFYELAHNESDSPVRVDRSGKIYSLKTFDRESQAIHTFVVVAYDEAHRHFNSTQRVLLLIEDENDNSPQFEQDCCTFYVPENSSPQKVGRLVAKDSDEGVNGTVSYSLQAATLANRYLWNLYANGTLMLAMSALDREKVEHYYLVVRAFDHGVLSLTSTITVTIVVVDVNDHAPRFTFPNSSVSSINVSVNSKMGSVIGQLQAVDADAEENGRLSFERTSTTDGCHVLIEVERDSGELRLSADADIIYNKYRMKYCQFEVSVLDNATPPLKSQTLLQIQFIDVGHLNTKRIVNPDEVASSSAYPPFFSSRELILSLGIGLAILVLCCVAMLLIYFCYYLQKTSCLNCEWSCFGMQDSLKNNIDSENISKQPQEKSFSSVTPRQESENNLYLKSGHHLVQSYAVYSPADRDSGHGSLHKKLSDNREHGKKFYMNDLKECESRNANVLYCKLDSSSNIGNENGEYGCLDVDSTINPYCVYEGGNVNAATLHVQRPFHNQQFSSIKRGRHSSFTAAHMEYDKAFCSTEDTLEKQKMLNRQLGEDRSGKKTDGLGTIQRHAGYVYGSPYDSSSFV